MYGMEDQQREELGRRVTAARLERGLGKEAAARDIGVSSITLKRVEDGLSVRDDILSRVLRFFGLPIPGVGLQLETPISEGNVDAIRRLIEQSDIAPDLKDRLLGVIRQDVQDVQPRPGEVKGA